MEVDDEWSDQDKAFENTIDTGGYYLVSRDHSHANGRFRGIQDIV